LKTQELKRQLVHKWRTEEQAILTGRKTVLKDNPNLTSRNWYGNNPFRIILDKNLALNKELNIFNYSAKTLIFNYLKNETGKLHEYIKIDKQLNELEQILTILHKKNIQSVIVEGGTITHQSFIDKNYWDEARVFIGNIFFHDGTKAAKIDFSKQKQLLNFKNSSLYFLKNDFKN